MKVYLNCFTVDFFEWLYYMTMVSHSRLIELQMWIQNFCSCIGENYLSKCDIIRLHSRSSDTVRNYVITIKAIIINNSIIIIIIKIAISTNSTDDICYLITCFFELLYTKIITFNLTKPIIKFIYCNSMYDSNLEQWIESWVILSESFVPFRINHSIIVFTIKSS